MKRARAVVASGGFAGLNAAKALSRLAIDVTLIDRRNFHLFQPLLYQVASGGLSPGDITAPLRHVFKGRSNVRILMAEVTGVDPAARRVLVRDGDPLEYDWLVLAPGARNFYFGNDGWEQHAPALKSIEDATEIRRRILTAFERAECEPDAAARKEWLRFVVVGAGPTGCELAGAIAEISRDTMRGDFRLIRPEESEILLVDGNDRLLPPFQPDLSEKAERLLIGLGVRARTKVRVTGIDATGIDLISARGAERIATRTVLWAAGVRSSDLTESLGRAVGAEVDRSGRVRVAPDLSLPSHPDIFIVGDAAWVEQDGAALPGTAPVAMQQGTHVARVIASVAGRSRPPFRFVNRGTMAVIGRNAAVADLGFARFGGPLAWLAWLLLHLMYLVGFQNRVLVALRWCFQYLTYNRGARLITGQPPVTAPPPASGPGSPSA